MVETILNALAAVGGIGGAVAGTIGAVRGSNAQKRNNTLAARVTLLEHSREHDRLAPPAPESVQLEREGDAWFTTIRTPRTYRVGGWAVSADGGRRRLDLPLALAGNLPHRFEVEKTRKNGGVVTTHLEIRFWAPADGDPGEGWSCLCGRDGKDGHWQWSVPVEPPPAPSRFYSF